MYRKVYMYLCNCFFTVVREVELCQCVFVNTIFLSLSYCVCVCATDWQTKGVLKEDDSRCENSIIVNRFVRINY